MLQLLPRLNFQTMNSRLHKLLILALLSLLLSACESPGPQKETTQQTVKPSEPITPSSLSELDQSQYFNALEYLAQGKIKKAQKSLLKLEKKYEGHSGIQINLANSFFQLGELDKAKKHCELALRIDSKIANTHNLLGLIAVENKQFPQAQKHYEQALALNKKFANAHYNIALLYDIYFQNIAKAYQHYEQYLALVPNDQATKDWLEQLKYSLEQ